MIPPWAAQETMHQERSAMSSRCDQCRRTFRGAGNRTVTGRVLCERCHTTLLGASAGLIAGGGIEGAISTAGWLHRVRSAMRRGRGGA